MVGLGGARPLSGMDVETESQRGAAWSRGSAPQVGTRPAFVEGIKEFLTGVHGWSRHCDSHYGSLCGRDLVPPETRWGHWG